MVNGPRLIGPGRFGNRRARAVRAAFCRTDPSSPASVATRQENPTSQGRAGHREAEPAGAGRWGYLTRWLLDPAFLWIACILAWLPAGIAMGTESDDPESLEFFENRIRPVLVRHCYECHSTEANPPQGGLLVDTRAGLRAGGDSGAAVVPGDVGGSLLLRAIRYDESFYQMPPDGKLPEHVIADFERWIAMGAPDPRAGEAVVRSGIDWDTAREHWAFQPIQTPELPPVQGVSWPASEVDRFILERLESAGLRPALRADRRTWIRRVTFDLTGLPPTPEEIDDFLADASPHAFETVVDRLLASPHYGERQARLWMDLVRFAETNGHNRDIEKPHAFRYRDYLIDAFNQDLPYDRFILEQLAGDQLEPRDTADGRFNASLMATGMLWFSELHHNPVDPLLQRADQVDDQIDTVGKTFLALTLGCSRCHDHKFDPVPITDYYALAGIFHSTKSVSADISRVPLEIEGNPSTKTPEELEAKIKRWLFDAVDAPRLIEVRRAAEYMQATAELIRLKGDEFESRVTEIAEKENINRDILRQWMVFLNKSDTPRNANLGPWLELIRQPESRMQYAIEELLSSPRPQGAKPINPFTVKALTEPPPESFADLAGRYQRIMERVITTKTYDSPRHKQWLNWFHRPDTPFTAAAFAEDLEEEQLEHLEAKRRELNEAKLQAEVPQALASADANEDRWPEVSPIRSPFAERKELSKARMGDARLHIRGSHLNLGEPVPRGFLTILSEDSPLKIEQGSGRLELARAIADPANSLTARVMVNRVWAQHFSEGLVRTVDDFGTQGEPPTHPELLDFLAERFISSGWSIKRLHRMMVLSSTYRMSSRPAAEAMQTDPGNRLWHHVPVRRLDAESIRDAILAVSGSLDRSLFGKGVDPYLTPYMYPRYRPPSGPLDGQRRRSVYLTVRRNFVPTLLAAFDRPAPAETTGRRDVTHVPSQALVLMNNEFVHQQAEEWGTRVSVAEGTEEERLERMVVTALGRPPEADERERIVTFWSAQSGTGAERWAAVAHVLFNVKPFVFVR